VISTNSIDEIAELLDGQEAKIWFNQTISVAIRIGSGNHDIGIIKTNLINFRISD